jgi:hypothetical protein
MTAFTINGGAVTNWDTLSGGSVNATLDTYAISNNTVLLIETDSYQCAGHSAAAGSLDTVTYSGIGGTLRISGQNVRVIPYTTGTGNVPAIGSTVTQGGVSATLLGVWSGWQVEPAAAGAALPASGWVKVKNKTGGNFAAGALVVGVAAATASGPDVTGWIEVRGADTATITVPRVGKVEVLGEWFDLGTTSGARGQVLQCPTTATIAGVMPGVWIETAAGSGIYERFPGVGSMVNLAGNPTDVRGKVVWQTTGGIRIGSDGTNNVGFLPPAGCKVRVPNVFLTCCTRTAGGSGARVLPSATLITRQEFVTTNAGDISITGAVVNWYCNFAQAFRAKVANSAVSDTLVQSEIASPIDLSEVTVAPTQAQLNLALNMTSCFAGGAVTDCTFTRFSLAASGAYVNAVNYTKGVTFTRVHSQALTNRANATTGTWSCTQSIDLNWTDCKNIGGRVTLVGCVRPVFTNPGYADLFSGTTQTANPHAAIDTATATTGLRVAGMNFLGLTNVQPYTALVTSLNCYDMEIAQIGTFAAPLNLGSANQTGLIFNGAGNNDGVRLKRIYTVNTRTGPWAFINSDNDILIENVAGDYADASVMAGLNATIKGAGLTAATTGQVSVYGTHWLDQFTSATAGMIEIACNEPTADSADQCVATAGTPRFNSAGQVALTAIGDQVQWTAPYQIKGHTALANLAPTLTGTNTGNVTYEYQIDTGAGFSAWKTLNAANLSGETISAAGFGFKLRATCAVANAGNLLTNIRVATVTTGAAQSTNLYPLAVVTLTLDGLQSGSDVVIYEAGTGVVRQTFDQIAGVAAAYTYETPETVDVGIFKAGLIPLYIRGLVLGTQNTTVPVAQAIDRAYLA